MDSLEDKIYILNFVLDHFKKQMGERLQKSKDLLDHKIMIGDIHSHSIHSDGRCTVDELKQYADIANMDFLFVTDHDSLDQRPDCEKYDNVWVGQESGCNDHHVGLLSPDLLFKPDEKKSFRENLENARSIAPFTWIPHPTGWMPATNYDEQVINQLFDIGDSFAMEVLNGVFKITDVFDPWQEKNIQLWDRLLLAGKKVTPVAGSDAHFAAGTGCVWTGCLGADCNTDSVIKKLNSGHTIASEGPLAVLSCQQKIQGDTIKVKNNEKLELHIKASDSMGLTKVKLIRNGRNENIFDCKDEILFEDSHIIEIDANDIYFRLECISTDFKHAYTSPIYIKMIK